jgi:cytochrome c553
MKRLLACGALPALALAVVVPGLALAQGTAGGEAEVRAVLDLKSDVARGRKAYDECAPCHRKDASGRVDGSVPRLSGQHVSVIVKQVVDIRAGRRLNPPMKEVLDDGPLAPQALADIAAYLQGLPLAGRLGKGPGKDAARGKVLYEKDCAACHGREGGGNAAAFIPMVAAQHYLYLVRELQMIRDGARGNSNPAMVGIVKTYGAGDLEAVADHLAQLPPPAR